MGRNGAIVGGSGSGETGKSCQYTSDCDGGLVCDIKRELCVVCRTDSDCGPRSVCEANDCVETGTDGGTSTGGTGASGGSTPRGGTGGTGGTASGGTASGGTGGVVAGVCADTAVTCVDATHASGCNPATGEIDTFSCVDEARAIGIVSSGCVADALNGDSCSFDSFTDQACVDGTAAFGYCENATADDQLFNIYVNCFLDNMGGHTVIPCFSQYVTTTMKTSQDCLNAEDACFGAAAGGTGGTPPIASAGAGGAP